MSVRILVGDVREKLAELPDESVHCVVTSPPYFGLRDYGVAGQIGLEPTPAEFVAVMVGVFREVRRVLRKDGTLWLNLGDSYAGSWAGNSMRPEGGTQRPGGPGMQPLDDGRYAPRGGKTFGLKQKDLLGIPWRVAFALQADGWTLRQDIIWAKPNPMPESVTDRCTKAHEYLFLLSKSARYHYDAEAIAEAVSDTSGAQAWRRIFDPEKQTKEAALKDSGMKGGNDGQRDAGATSRNRRSVWTVATQPFSDWTSTVQKVRVAADAPDDGKKRTTSPDCPVHGDRFAPSATALDGEHAAASSPRSAGNADLFQAPVSDCAPIAPLPEAVIAPQNLDLPSLLRGPSAKPHSKRSRKTDRALETTLSCTPCVGMSPRIGDTSAAHGLSDLADRMPESNTVQGELVDSPSNQTACGSVRTPDEQALSLASGLSQCTCEWYVEKTSKTSHFATFPPDLIEPCIKAGCPKDCCAKCGAPVVRQLTASAGGKRSWHDHSQDAEIGMAQVKQGQKDWDSYVAPQTTGWSPSCSCDPSADLRTGAGLARGVVLDPFGGAGTTGLVADRLQRDAILIELNPEYAALAERRIHDDGELFSRVTIAGDGAQPIDEQGILHPLGKGEAHSSILCGSTKIPNEIND